MKNNTLMKVIFNVDIFATKNLINNDEKLSLTKQQFNDILFSFNFTNQSSSIFLLSLNHV